MTTEFCQCDCDFWKTSEVTQAVRLTVHEGVEVQLAEENTTSSHSATFKMSNSRKTKQFRKVSNTDFMPKKSMVTCRLNV